ncbi:class I SAM-dependent methyltransferase [Chryseobacterium indologenes]|uniref:class I SAM-dependent methyltransferase n=1 Tax=Chryseobacterium TaxID=59732 RepID=UPI0016244EC3|nr:MULTISPECIES: class I SAM-dependent methyltransferase [Chryseobacterium]MDM1556514.1 class I SAM-dependent methyltransferase [Chryseobacterium indologenes]WET47818.1 class I SAM-dependent methyltransferase [Chryseobacterium indologenes]
MSALRAYYYKLPPGFRLLGRKLYYFPIDFYEGVTGKRAKNEPKKGDIYVGSSDFIPHGIRQMNALKKYIALKNTDHVLDIGCGIGRTAVALSGFIDKGTYDGFDAVEKGIKWCNKHIHKKYLNFNFKFTPIYNDLYNTFSQKAENFIFPYDEAQFDKAFLFSVFTHMQVPEIQQYLNEISRVLKSGGQCLATFFLYDESKKEGGSMHFPHQYKGYRLMDDKVTAANIAVSVPLLNQMAHEAGLKVKTIQGGFWRNDVEKEGADEFQDIVVFEKI